MANLAPGNRSRTTWAMTWAVEWRRTARPSSLSSVTTATLAPSGSGAARSIAVPSTVTATAAAARRRPMPAARSAPVAPSGRERSEPSGRETVMLPAISGGYRWAAGPPKALPHLGEGLAGQGHALDVEAVDRHVEDHAVEAAGPELGHLLAHLVGVTQYEAPEDHLPDARVLEGGAVEPPGGQHPLELGHGLVVGRCDDERPEPRLHDGGRVPPHVGAVAGEDLELVGQLVLGGDDVAGVGVLGHQPERHPLAGSADEDGWPAGRDRPGHVEGTLDAVVLPGVGRGVLGEHGLADVQGVDEPLEPLPQRREVEVVAPVLLLVPGRADAEEGPTPGDDVEVGHDLRQVGRVPVRDAGDEGAELHPRGAGRQCGQEGVAIEHVTVGWAHHG